MSIIPKKNRSQPFKDILMGIGQDMDGHTKEWTDRP